MHHMCVMDMDRNAYVSLLEQMRLAAVQSWQHSGVKMRLNIISRCKSINFTTFACKNDNTWRVLALVLPKIINCFTILFTQMWKTYFSNSISVPVYSIFNFFLRCYSFHISPLFLSFSTALCHRYDSSLYFTICLKCFPVFPSNILQFSHFQLKSLLILAHFFDFVFCFVFVLKQNIAMELLVQIGVLQNAMKGFLCLGRFVYPWCELC